MCRMPFWFVLPETGAGWVFFLLSWAIQGLAVRVVVRDVRGRRLSGWDVAAVVFVVVAGPGAAGAFLAAHGVLERRADRRAAGAVRQ